MMATNRTLLEQARELQALAQTGLMYCKDPFDRERYERIRAMAVDMLSTQVDAPCRVSSLTDSKRSPSNSVRAVRCSERAS